MMSQSASAPFPMGLSSAAAPGTASVPGVPPAGGPSASCSEHLSRMSMQIAPIAQCTMPSAYVLCALHSQRLMSWLTAILLMSELEQSPWLARSLEGSSAV